ncbi:thiamine phosphate synthase [Aquibacillus kalidii]|uniref:thiamine phosphate synthase n=1 Tax=Aquibacillus kalidii TaxID=2762597 RepID=UPI001648CBA4|nr:thiamine phosphate synthase [Aquibacillus kalidii]
MDLKRSLQAYFIMGSNNSDKDPLLVLDKALQGGITFFQFREKGENALEGNQKKELAMKMQELCKKYKVPFIVNDDVTLAIEINADGVHVGQDDESVTEIRKKCPSHFIIGVSATNTEQAIQAVRDGADYIGVGPIYATSTKADAKQPIGTNGMIEIRKLVGDVPIVAIGGIKQVHVPEIIKAGADGVSVITAISMANDPGEVARQINHLVSQHALK